MIVNSALMAELRATLRADISHYGFDLGNVTISHRNVCLRLPGATATFYIAVAKTAREAATACIGPAAGAQNAPTLQGFEFNMLADVSLVVSRTCEQCEDEPC